MVEHWSFVLVVLPHFAFVHGLFVKKLYAAFVWTIPYPNVESQPDDPTSFAVHAKAYLICTLVHLGKLLHSNAAAAAACGVAILVPL